MARCLACNDQIRFGDDLCSRCDSAKDNVYKSTDEDVSMIEAIMYANKQPCIIDGVYDDIVEEKIEESSHLV